MNGTLVCDGTSPAACGSRITIEGKPPAATGDRPVTTSVVADPLAVDAAGGAAFVSDWGTVAGAVEHAVKSATELRRTPTWNDRAISPLPCRSRARYGLSRSRRCTTCRPALVRHHRR